ncbi:hypothetical protein VTK73DRAFT_8695 [Phialemonium thermophilum]|uniref:Secreted protein n=1 Tax=Phialemonium thermophilum TaxID=223376 RepID=A0ABR3W7H2_9PEZI
MTVSEVLLYLAITSLLPRSWCPPKTSLSKGVASWLAKVINFVSPIRHPVSCSSFLYKYHVLPSFLLLSSTPQYNILRSISLRQFGPKSDFGSCV